MLVGQGYGRAVAVPAPSWSYWQIMPEGPTITDAPTIASGFLFPVKARRKADQEQTQIIKTAKGRPTPRAFPMVNANAESKSVPNSRPDMTHSKEPPRALPVAQRINDQKAGNRDNWHSPDPDYPDADRP